MTRLQREKAKKLRLLPEYIPTDDERNYYKFCVRASIRISPIGTAEPGKWYIGISDPSNYRKVYNSKFIYDHDTIWPEFYKMCKWYYDKH